MTSSKAVQSPYRKKRSVAGDTVSQRVEIVVRDMILSGEIKPGERLNEVALAASLDVSRGPLREAIQRLSRVGLLTTISHRGTFVRTFERTEVTELYELRMAIELHAVRLLSERSSDEDLTNLDTMLSQTQDLLEAESSTAYPDELDFHLRLVMLTGNESLSRVAVDTHRQLYVARSMSAKVPVRAREALNEHRGIVAALQRRDTSSALELMTEHLTHSKESVLLVLGIQGDES